MDIKDIVNQIYNEMISRKSPRQIGFVLDLFISRLLEHHIKLQGKQFIMEHHVIIRKEDDLRRRVTFDGYAPEGFDDFRAGTIVEIFTAGPTIPIRSRFKDIERMLERNYHAYLNTDVQDILIIILTDMSTEETKNYEQNLNDKFSSNNTKLHIWGLKELDDLSQLHPEFLNRINNPLEFLFEVEIEQSVQNIGDSRGEWKKIQEERIKDLKLQYDQDNLVLFLGAGASIDAKIATWDQLISDLLVTLVSKKLDKLDVKLTDTEKAFIADNLKKMNGNSPLQLVRYIRNGLDEFFLETISEVLYKNAEDSSPLLDEICKLCLPTRTGVGIQGVVTYNFDDLLERNLESRELKHTSIYKEAQLPGKEELGIYHVHGFLPRDLEKYEGISESSLIFSEEGYHSVMLDAFNWSNLIQLNYFKERTCLFIGVSLTDPNIRRLLDIAMTKQPDKTCRHYIFLKRENFEIPTNSEFNTDNIKRFEAVNQDQKEKFFQELGLNIIWFEDYPEITQFLKKLRG
ncbi:SIR2 family protein [Peribacillus sp. NPDC060253]|uniref:SIR2 family protein n=1 Tax=Peribacillus sp. NPDC060253 TaxID=3347084 RepID=UPI0036474AF1